MAHVKRISPRPILGAAVLIVVCSALNGKSGFLVGAGVVVTLVGGVRPRGLIALAGALFVLTPLSMLRQGLVAPEQLSLQLVSRYSLSNNLAFAGFAYLVVGVLLETYPQRPEHGGAGPMLQPAEPVGAPEPPDQPHEPHEAVIADLTATDPTGDDLAVSDPMALGFRALERALQDTSASSVKDTEPT